MEDREKFVQEIESVNKKRDLSKVIYARGANAFFSRFELTLPSRSKLKRLSKDSIAIDTDRFLLILKVDFSGLSTVITPSFHKYFLGLNRTNEINDLEVKIQLDVKFKPSALFSVSGWHYYFWLDSFVKNFGENFTENAFFSKIAWEQSLTVLDFLDKKTELLTMSDVDQQID